MANETEIVNMALSLIGDSRITSMTDTSTNEGVLAVLFYAQARDEVIGQSGVDWKVAIERLGPLAALSTAPSFGWDNQYQLPEDLLRLIGLVTDLNDIPLGVEWKREGTKLLTNEDTVHILYIKRITETATFPPLLVQAIYLKLGSKLAFPITRDKVLRRELLEEFYRVVNEDAMQANAAEGFVKDEKGVDTWAAAGRTGRT